MIKGVLFDMDGVLLDTERIGREIYLNKCAELGYPQMNLQMFECLLGNTRERDRELMLEMLGSDFPFDEMYEAYRSELLTAACSGGVPCRPGVKECFEGLKKCGLKIALATSTSRPTVEEYQKHIPELCNVFDFMVCGAEGGRSKPAPDIYLKAAQGLGLDIAECAGVEDSLNGLKSLTAAGAVRVMVPDLLPCDERFAGVVDYELASLHQLCGLIDRLNLNAKIKA